MKNLLLLFLAFFSCHSQSERIVDGIDYSTITVSDSIVESDGKVTAIDVKIDYPRKINIESCNIRKIIVYDIETWLENYRIMSDSSKYDIPVELISDSLRSWIHNPNRNRFTKSLIIEPLSSGIEGITTIRRCVNSHHIIEYSIDVKSGSVLMFEDILGEQNIEGILLLYLRIMKQDIVNHGIEYDESKIDTMVLTFVPFIVNQKIYVFYSEDKNGMPYYITIPIEELEPGSMKIPQPFRIR